MSALGNAGLRGVDQKSEPPHTALVVIDMQNDFCAEGGMMHNEGLDLSRCKAWPSDSQS